MGTFCQFVSMWVRDCWREWRNTIHTSIPEVWEAFVGWIFAPILLTVLFVWAIVKLITIPFRSAYVILTKWGVAKKHYRHSP